MAGYRIVSSDNHIFEPPGLWTDRASPKFRDRAPRVVNLDGGDFWVCEDKRVSGASAVSQAGRRFDEPENLATKDTFENVPLGAYLPEEHVKDMDIDGIDVSIVYPTVACDIQGSR